MHQSTTFAGCGDEGGLYIMQRVFRGHGCEEKAIADGVAVGAWVAWVMTAICILSITAVTCF